jgi:hypothetical protein
MTTPKNTKPSSALLQLEGFAANAAKTNEQLFKDRLQAAILGKVQQALSHPSSDLQARLQQNRTLALNQLTFQLTESVQQQMQRSEAPGRKLMENIGSASQTLQAVRSLWKDFYQRYSQEHSWRNEGDALTALIPGLKVWFNPARSYQVYLFTLVVEELAVLPEVKQAVLKELLACLEIVASAFRVLRQPEPEEVVELRKKVRQQAHSVVE